MHASHSPVHFANAPWCAGSSGNAIFTVDVSTNPPTYLSTYVTNLGGGPGDITLGPDGNLYLAQSTGGFDEWVAVYVLCACIVCIQARARSHVHVHIGG